MISSEGRNELEVAPAEVTLESADELPRAVPAEQLPELTDEQIRDMIEATRR